MRDDIRFLLASVRERALPVTRLPSGGLRLTRTGQWVRLFAMPLLVALVALLMLRHGAGATGGATIAAMLVTYNPTARSVCALLGLYPVKLYGAKLDASADSTTAMQSALDAAAAATSLPEAVAVGQTGGAVIVPTGATIKCGGVVPRSGVAIQSHGGKLLTNANGTAIITNSVGQAIVDGFSVSGVEFVGEGQSVGTSSERRGALLIYNGKNVRIRDCVAHGFSWCGFAVRNAQNVWMQDNYLYDICQWFYGNGLEISLGLANSTPAPEATSRAVITGNVVKNCRTAPVCIQATAHQSEFTGPVLDYDVIVADNPFLEAMVENVTGHGFAAVALEIARYGTPGGTSQGNHIAKVHIHHNHCYVHGTSGASSPVTWGITATDNNGSNGPQSTDWDEFCDVIIDHNTIDSVDGGIISQASRGMIDHNVLRVDKRGISAIFNNAAGHVPEQIMVDGNLVHIDASKAVAAGIHTNGTLSTTIQNNRVSYYGTAIDGQANLSDGIYALNASKVRIFNNTTRGSTRHGIHLNGVTDYSVENNRAINPSSGATNTYHALYLNNVIGSGSTKGLVHRNELTDDRGAGAMMAQSLSILGGTPRASVLGNRMLGWNTFSVGYTGGQIWWWADNDIGTSAGPMSSVGITPSGSPFTYTATPSSNQPYAQQIIVRGGTVNSIKLQHGAVVFDTGLTAGLFLLKMNQSIIVDYSVAPTMLSIPS